MTRIIAFSILMSTTFCVQATEQCPPIPAALKHATIKRVRIDNTITYFADLPDGSTLSADYFNPDYNKKEGTYSYTLGNDEIDDPKGVLFRTMRFLYNKKNKKRITKATQKI